MLPRLEQRRGVSLLPRLELRRGARACFSSLDWWVVSRDTVWSSHFARLSNLQRVPAGTEHALGLMGTFREKMAARVQVHLCVCGAVLHDT